ncbi:uncharacterized protein TNCV_3024981 [Trichonephila clavipes]|nr:uncharacterized protein TNCV_3024981 [Trichonephila clavipes]
MCAKSAMFSPHIDLVRMFENQIEAHEIHHGKGLDVRLSLAVALSTILLTVRFSSVPLQFWGRNPGVGSEAYHQPHERTCSSKAVYSTPMPRRQYIYTGLKKLAHVTTLEEDLKQQPLCQDSPKDVLSDSSLDIELAIPFVPNRDPPDTPQQSELGSCIIIHQNEVVTNSSSIWADIWIKGLIPTSKTSYGSSMEHMQVKSEIPAQTRIPPPL